MALHAGLLSDTKQISRGCRACFGVTKILKVLWEILLGTLPTFNKTREEWEIILRMPVAEVLVIRCENKLAEVLEHVLGMNKYKKSLENSAEKASNDNTKKQTPKKS